MRSQEILSETALEVTQCHLCHILVSEKNHKVHQVATGGMKTLSLERNSDKECSDYHDPYHSY